MTTNLGLIEWVDNTKPLRACIEQALDNKSRMIRVQDRYRAWIAQKGGKGIGRFEEQKGLFLFICSCNSWLSESIFASAG
jgi:hypothetical protein